MTSALGGQDESVYVSLRNRVVEGHYQPGVRLVEQTIARELGVSRTPVREALRRLESDGLVVSERNRGAEVRAMTAAEVDDLYELRGRLESYAAELAAQRRLDEEVAGIREAADHFAAAAAMPSGPHDVTTTRPLNQANRSFHDRVVACARHPRLAALLAGTVDVPLVFRALQRFRPDELRRSALFHHLIADAIADGEAVRAGRLMAEHIAQGGDMVRTIIAGDG